MKFHHFFVTFFIIISFFGCDNSGIDTQHIYLQNKKIRLGFDSQNGAFVIFDDLTHKQSLLDTVYKEKSIWQVNCVTDSGVKTVDMFSARQFSLEKTTDSTLTMHWRQFDDTNYPDLHVAVSVRLGKNQSFSYWKIHLSGIEGKMPERVIFPIISGFKDMGEEECLAMSMRTGVLLKNPRQNLERAYNVAQTTASEENFIPVAQAKVEYPHYGSMQLVTLYHPDKIGFYASCNDSLAFRKEFNFRLEEPNNLIYDMHHFPEYDLSKDSYSPTYEAVIGSYKGDWLTAAEHYRDEVKSKKWARESRLKNGLVPTWAQETAFWVYFSGEFIKQALDLQQKTGLPVSAFWHLWFSCVNDVGYPEYLPPLGGRSQFIEQVDIAKQQGINTIVYINSLGWGSSTESWEKEHASLYSSKNIYGKERSIVWNKPTGKALVDMCPGTEFWRNKYASLADTMINNYHLSGVYLDQASDNILCYDPTHEHPVGGGNYLSYYKGKMTTQIRDLTKGNEMPVLGGEGTNEVMLPYLDVFWAFYTSRERVYIDVWEPIPLFHAVYRQYAITFGNVGGLSLLRDDRFIKDFLTSHARTFVWGSQPTISGYSSAMEDERKPEMDFFYRTVKVRIQGLKYLQYGEYRRVPEPEIPYPKREMVTFRSPTGEMQREVPVIYSSAWKADDGTFGICYASISDEAFPLKLKVNAAEYGLPKSGNVSVIDETGKKLLTSYRKGKISIEMELPSRGVCIIVIES